MSDDAKDEAFERWKMGRCRYRCQECQKVFANSLRFHFHAASEHGLDSLQYRRRHGRARIGSHRVVCALCREPVLHDYVKLRVHMEKRHDCMDLKRYFLRHVYGRQEPSVQESDSSENVKDEYCNAGSSTIPSNLLANDEENEDEDEELPDLEPVPLPGPSGSDFRQEPDRDDINDEDWLTSSEEECDGDGDMKKGSDCETNSDPECDGSPLTSLRGNDDVESAPEDTTDEHQERELSTSVSNMCSYRCPKCKATFDKWTTLKSHNLRMPCGTGNAKFDRAFLVHEVYHVCRECDKELLCDKTFLTWHMKCHKVSLETYAKKYKLKMVNKVEKKSPKVRKKAVKAETPLNKPSKVCDVADSESSLTGPILNIVGDFCYYGCMSSCDRNFSNWTALAAHHAIDHGVRISFDVKFVLKAAYHKCWVCSKTLYCDEELVRRHIRKHSTWEEYLSGCPADGRTVPWIHSACIFTCRGCHAVARTYRSSSRVAHDCERGPGRAVWEPVSKLMHACAICDAQVWCDEVKIYRHVKGAHSATWEEYKKQCPNPPLISQKLN